MSKITIDLVKLIERAMPQYGLLVAISYIQDESSVLVSVRQEDKK